MPGRAWATLAVVGMIALSSALIVRADPQSGATFDEPFYVAKGLESWRTGSNRALMTAGTMPLPVDVATLPLYAWETWRGTPFHPVNDFAELLPVARRALLPFWWLLVTYAALWGYALGRGGGAVFAAGFVAFEPNLLAHAALATTDIAACATITAAAFHFYAGRGAKRLRRVVVPRPLVCRRVVYESLRAGVRADPVFGDRAVPPPAPGALVVARHGAVAHRLSIHRIDRRGRDARLRRLGLGHRTSFVAWADGLRDSPGKPVLRNVARHLRVFPNGLEGLVQQVKHNSRGHGAYLLGIYHRARSGTTSRSR